MNAFIIKLIAMIAMLTDHCAFAAQSAGVLPEGGVYLILRSVGRIAFPVYAFMLVNGFSNSRSRKQYLGRLTVLAVISQLPFSMLTSELNYSGCCAAFEISFAWRYLPMLCFPAGVWLVYACGKKADRSFWWMTAALLMSQVRISAFGMELITGKLNVFYTLALGLAAMMYTERLKCGKKTDTGTLLCAAAMVTALIFVGLHSDYDILGLILIIGLYTCRSRRMMVYVTGVWCFCVYLLMGREPVMFVFSLTAALMAWLYNGERGPGHKLLFYSFYPAHIMALVIIFQLLR